MAYLPKSKYKQKYTNGGEFYNPTTGEVYIGSYLELPNQIYYAGKSISKPGAKLAKLTFSFDKVPDTLNNRIFKALNSKYVDKELKYETPLSTKIFPTDDDYLKGTITRYFGYRIQTGRYFEIDEKTYSDIRSSDRIDRSLYSAGKITWALKGDLEKINGTNLLRLEQQYPGLRKLFTNLTEFGSL